MVGLIAKNILRIQFFVFLILFPLEKLCAKRVELKENIPLEKQLISPNCTYLIKGKYKLNHNCKIPSNCELLFEGGTIEGSYTLTGNNTYINAGPLCIFSSGISLAGTWLNERCYAEWFGARGDKKTDDRNALQKALDSPMPILELLPKTYLIASYYNEKEKVGLRVPVNKTVVGYTVDDCSKKYTIMAKAGMPFDVLLQLTGIHITLKNICVQGATGREYSNYKVRDLIATLQDKFYTGLHLEYVFVLGCKGNCINLYTYNSRLENCYATNCNVAYYMQGGNGRGTSVSLFMCTAERARINAYKLKQLSYSVLEVCAADHCALGSTTHTHTSRDAYGYNYYYEDCRGVSEISCAHEAGGFSHYINDCWGFSIKTGRYTNYALRGYEDWKDSMTSKMWIIKSSHDIEIGQTTFAYPAVDGSRVITIEGNTNKVRIEQGYYVNPRDRFIPITDAAIVNGRNKVLIVK